MPAEGLAVLLRAFRLPTMAAMWEQSVSRAERENWGYKRLLQHLCESEAQDRNGVDVQQHPHPALCDRRVDEELCRDHRQRHQGQRAHALEPGRPAEEQPPDGDGEAGEGRAENPVHRGVGKHPREQEPRPLQRHGDDTGPQAEGLPRRHVSLRDRHWQGRRFPRAFCSV